MNKQKIRCEIVRKKKEAYNDEGKTSNPFYPYIKILNEKRIKNFIEMNRNKINTININTKKR